MKPFAAPKRLATLPYHLRFMLALLVVESAVLLLIHCWPSKGIEEPSAISIRTDISGPVSELVIVTRQSPSAPIPMKPLVPAAEPEDIILPEVIDLQDVLLIDLPPSSVPQGSAGKDAGPIALQPQRPPAPSRIVEPEKERFAGQGDREMEIRVRFLVDEKGVVEWAEIESITIYMSDGRTTRMDSLPAELEGDVLDAARQWRFRPASLDGAPVRAFATGVFRF